MKGRNIYVGAGLLVLGLVAVAVGLPAVMHWGHEDLSARRVSDKVSEARTRRRTGDYEVALRMLEAALRMHPDYAAALFEKGNVLGEMGDGQGARACYERAAESNPHDLRVWAALRETYFAAGEYDKTIRAARKALEVAPNQLVPNYTRIAQAHLTMGETEEAAAALREGVARDCDFPTYCQRFLIAEKNRLLSREATDEEHARLERLSAELTKTDLAQFDGESVLRTFRREHVSRLHGDLAAVLLAQGEFKEAVTHCDQALALDPYYGAAYLHRASARHKLGQHTDALQDLERAARLGVQPSPETVQAIRNATAGHR